MGTYTLRVNGRNQTVESWDPNQPLLYVLRDEMGLYGPKFGCGLGQCGACTVLMGGQAVRSCLTPVSKAAGQSITTLEGD
jgi:nicotinate dehydrogenase subunit A